MSTIICLAILGGALALLLLAIHLCNESLRNCDTAQGLLDEAQAISRHADSLLAEAKRINGGAA